MGQYTYIYIHVYVLYTYGGLRETSRGCRPTSCLFWCRLIPLVLPRMEISDHTMDPLPLMMRLGVHTQATFQKDPFVFLKTLGGEKNNPSTQTLDLIFFEFPSWMYIVANLRISIRGLGQCMVLQTLRTHIWRYKNCVCERLLEWKHGTVCCMRVSGMEQLEHANLWISILGH